MKIEVALRLLQKLGDAPVGVPRDGVVLNEPEVDHALRFCSRSGAAGDRAVGGEVCQRFEVELNAIVARCARSYATAPATAIGTSASVTDATAS